jgi:hypothetical protein
MKNRFLSAMGCYAVLGLLSAFTLDGKLRLFLLILLGALAFKTYVAYKAGW